MKRPKRGNYSIRIYGEIAYNKQLNKYCSYLENRLKEQEEMYSEEEVLEILNTFNKQTLQLQKLKLGNSFNVKEWFEEFKNK